MQRLWSAPLRRAKRAGLALALTATMAAALTACGGGSEAPAAEAATPAQAVAGLRAKALAVSAASVAPTEAARQLMDFAEANFPQFFPSHVASQTAAPFQYRHYPSTGAYLGVVTAAGTGYVTNGVYVMGGPFGAEPFYVGLLTEFINPDFSVALAADKAVVMQGGTLSVPIQLNRTPGFDGAVSVTVSGLPAGVTYNALTIPANASSGTLVLSAQGSAPHSLPTGAKLTARSGESHSDLGLTVTVRGAAGALDTSFGGGVNITPIGYEDYANAVAVQADGKVIVAGASTTNGGTVVSLARYLRDGGLDPSFGAGGKVLTPVGTRDDAAAAIALQPDGRIVVAGSSDQGGDNGLDFMVMRYRADGTLDTSFGNGGKVVTPFGGDVDRAWALAIQADGKIVVAGETNANAASSGNDFALARYLPSGALDSGFGSGGKVVTALEAQTGRDAVYALALPMVGGEQRILAVGGDGDFVAARYTASGALDTSFASGGKIVGLFNAAIGAARAVTLLPGGQAVLAGGIDNDFAAVQLTPGGALDPSFGAGGKFRLDAAANGNWDDATAVVRQADGKLVLGGWLYTVGSASDFVAVRLLPNGTLDGGFGNAGIAVRPTAADTRRDASRSLVLQADDRVPTVRAIQAGESSASNYDFAVIRLWL